MEEERIWEEYDMCAEWCAKRKIKGNLGDNLPDLISSEVVDLINGDIAAFKQRINDFAYGLAMDKLNYPLDMD